MAAAAAAAAAFWLPLPSPPPQSPQVFTTFFLGSASFGYSLLPQVDAPETGRPTAGSSSSIPPVTRPPPPQRSLPTPRP
eukprot:COSAG01_NODE_21700_length_889_cov_1.855696_1_plen_78_part_10